jgi:hypothetical protein
MIIKQLLDARVINFVQQTLTSSVTHETIDRLLRKIANHKIMIVEPKLKRILFRSHFYNKMHWCNKSVSKLQLNFILLFRIAIGNDLSSSSSSSE